MSVIPVLGRLKQEGHGECEVNLSWGEWEEPLSLK